MKAKKINKMAALFFMLLCLSLSATPVSAAPKINKKTATVYVNKTVTLKINGAKRKPKWESSNTKIATVNKNGVVRGKKAGKVKITGYFNKEKKAEKKRYKCEVTVFDKSSPPTSKLEYDIKKAAPKAEEKVLDIFNAIGFKLKYRYIGNWTYGLTSTYDYDKSITLSTELFDTFKRIWKGNEQMTLETVTYHEIGHFIGWITDRSDLTSELNQIRREEDKRHTENLAEYFADSYMWWVLYRNKLKTEQPKTYQYIKEQIDYINNTPMSHWTTGYY